MKTKKRRDSRRVSEKSDLLTQLKAEHKARLENESALNNRVNELSAVIGCIEANVRKLARVVGVPESSLQSSQEAANVTSSSSVGYADSVGSKL